jgi:DNA-binding FadR family transcriptional regulator
VGFEPVRRKSLASEVFEQIRDQIVEGLLAPGERLPAERILADELAINRQAVREGLSRLEQMGLVQTRQGGGTKVLDYRRTAGLELMARLIVTRNGIDTAVVRSVLEMRRDLGRTVARRCASRADAQGAQRVTEAAEQLRRAAGSIRRQQRLALRFWDAVVDGTGILAYRLAFNSLEAAYGEVMDQLVFLMADEVSAVDDYDALAAAIEARDPDAAETAAAALTARGEAAVGNVLDVLDTGRA